MGIAYGLISRCVALMRRVSNCVHSSLFRLRVDTGQLDESLGNKIQKHA